ncbi:MAG: T9SS type A sorting domain-containing protein [Ignavibacteria bacterium]|nr:T9SS type A sorting domain-containing protein [Ignavibacteria bacterium]
MKFIDDQTGWVAGDAGYILRTTDGGHQRDSLNSLTHTGLYSIFFLNKDTGFVAGYNGLILKTTNGGGEGYPLNVVQLSNEMPEKFFLYQNYPNPFNPETVIRYSITESGFVVLKVYDVSGKVIQTLLNERQVAGTYSVKFDGNDLPNGVYFYELNTGIESVTKKMLLIK